MKSELKTFQWTCDNCGQITTTQAHAIYNSRPTGWISTSTTCEFIECRGGHEIDYCPNCVKLVPPNK